MPQQVWQTLSYHAFTRQLLLVFSRYNTRGRQNLFLWRLESSPSALHSPPEAEQCNYRCALSTRRGNTTAQCSFTEQKYKRNTCVFHSYFPWVWSKDMRLSSGLFILNVVHKLIQICVGDKLVRIKVWCVLVFNQSCKKNLKFILE